MQIQINQSQRELKSHGDFRFPVLVSEERLSGYEFGTFCWHWHPEIELTLVEKGRMLYEINGRAFELKEGDILFGNVNTLHSGHMIDNQDCHYRSITFDTKIIYGYENSLLHLQYVEPVVSSHQFSAFHFDGSQVWHECVRQYMQEMISLWKNRPSCYELKLQRSLSGLWLTMLENLKSLQDTSTPINAKELDRLKAILSFLHANYSQKITLDDIAGSVHLCKNECCRFFKKHMQESLFDYLLRYRIEQSIPFLQDSRYNVTDAALQNGFSEAGYYSRVFRKYMGCSPRELKAPKLQS